jgi:hypothetical protein
MCGRSGLSFSAALPSPLWPLAWGRCRWRDQAQAMPALPALRLDLAPIALKRAFCASDNKEAMPKNKR